LVHSFNFMSASGRLPHGQGVSPPPDMAIDMTPMIDMSFQLIAFFMILINFRRRGGRTRKLPSPAAPWAKPPDAPLETPITNSDRVSGFRISGRLAPSLMSIAGQEFSNPDGLKPVLNNEKFVLENKHKAPTDAKHHHSCPPATVKRAWCRT